MTTLLAVVEVVWQRDDDHTLNATAHVRSTHGVVADCTDEQSEGHANCTRIEEPAKMTYSRMVSVRCDPSFLAPAAN